MNVEDSQLVHIRNKETAQDVWISLRSAHEKDTLTNRVSLYKRIAMLKMKEDGKAEEHLNDLLNLFQKLEDLGQEGDEQWKIGMAFASLPPSYSTLITALEARSDDDLSWALVQSKILDEDLRQRELKKANETENIDHEKVYKIKQSEKNQRKHCYFCKLDNHSMKDCLKLKRFNEFKEFQELTKDKEKDQVHEITKENTSEDESDEYILTIYPNKDEGEMSADVNSKSKRSMDRKMTTRDEIFNFKIDQVNTGKQLKGINELAELFEKSTKLGDEISDNWKSTILLNKLPEYYSEIEIIGEMNWKIVKRRIMKRIKIKEKSIVKDKFFETHVL